MTETANLSYQEVKEILAIFFDLPVGKIKCRKNYDTSRISFPVSGMGQRC